MAGRIKKELLFHWENVKLSMLSSMGLRESFLMQALFLLFSNLIFFSFWFIYFGNFQQIKSWTIKDMACLYGIVSGAYGIFTLFFGGTRYLARFIFEGDLDALMTRPKNLLLQIVGLKSLPAGWGDIFSSLLLLIYSGYLTPSTLPLIAMLVVSGVCYILAFSILTGSLAFWMGDSHCLGKQIFEFLLTFSNYPKAIYQGAVKLFLLVVIPSGMIGFVPVEALKNEAYLIIAIVLFCSITYLTASIWIFNRGLKRYSSGNQMGFRI